MGWLHAMIQSTDRLFHIYHRLEGMMEITQEHRDTYSGTVVCRILLPAHTPRTLLRRLMTAKNDHTRQQVIRQ